MGGGLGAKERRRLKRQDDPVKEVGNAKQASSGGSNNYKTGRGPMKPKRGAGGAGKPKTVKKATKPKFKKPKHLKRKLESLDPNDEANRKQLLETITAFESRKGLFSKNDEPRREWSKRPASPVVYNPKRIDPVEALRKAEIRVAEDVKKVQQENVQPDKTPASPTPASTPTPKPVSAPKEAAVKKGTPSKETPSKKMPSKDTSSNNTPTQTSIATSPSKSTTAEKTEKIKPQAPKPSSEKTEKSAPTPSPKIVEGKAASDNDDDDDDDNDNNDELTPKKQRGKRRRGRKDTSKLVEEMGKPDSEETPETAADAAESTPKGDNDDASKKDSSEDKESGDDEDSSPRKRTKGEANDGRYCLGRKPVTDFTVGKVYEGKVVYAKPFGVFFDIGCHSDAFCHVSRLRDDFVEKPQKLFKEGDMVQARVVEVNRRKKRITVSLQSEARAADERASIDARKDRLERREKRTKSKKPKMAEEASSTQQPIDGDDNTAAAESKEPTESAPKVMREPSVLETKHESEMTPAELKRARKLQRRAERRAAGGDVEEVLVKQ